MANHVVHRIVEEHASTHGQRTAIEHDGHLTTYRDLNQRANTIARQLLGQGYHRGGHVIVEMPHGCDLAAVLLAVLKAGGAYTWIPARTAAARSHASFASGPGDCRRQHQPIDLCRLLAGSGRPGPNLPILTRPADIACVLSTADGRDPLLVPHSTIATLTCDVPAMTHAWTGDPTTFDLWAGLLSGATLEVASAELQKVA